MMQLIEKMGGIRTFGILSICLFVTVFTAAMALAFCVKKQFLSQMSALPLEDEERERRDNPSNKSEL